MNFTGTRILLLLITVLSGIISNASVITKINNEVPVIFVDNRPLSKLIYAGSTINAPVIIGKSWTKIKYTYKCPYNDNKAFIQINFGRNTGIISFRNFIFAENDKEIIKENFNSAHWQTSLKLLDFKKIGVKSFLKSNSLHVDVPKRVEFPWDVQLCSNKVKLKKGMKYTVSFEVKTTNTQWILSSYLMRMNPLRFYGAAGTDKFNLTAGYAISNGVNVLSPSLRMPWPEREDMYEAEVAIIGTYLNKLKKTYPKSKWIMRIGVEPPSWWRKRNPDEMLKWEDGTIGRYVCVASEKWLNDMQKYLDKLIKICEKNWGEMIIGYIPVGQNTGEWYYPIWINRQHGSMNHSTAFRKGYQIFLTNRYKNITKLKQAWKKDFSSFNDIKVPSSTARQRGTLGIFRHPLIDKELFDFSEYQQYAMRSALEKAAAAIKQACGNKKLVMAFYGYLFELSGLKDGITATGHLQLGELLRSRNIDGIIDIISYYDRGVAGTGCLMTPVESITGSGKQLFTEDDSRTHLSSKNAGYERTTSAMETAWAQKRNLARSLVHNAYSWKFDLYGEGWFADKSLWKQLNSVLKTFARGKTKPFKSNIAVIVDEKSFMALRPGINLTKPLVYDLRSEISRTGFGEAASWLLDDLVDGKITDKYKLVIFVNAFLLNKEKRMAIKKYCIKTGCTALWLYAPGYLSNKGEDFDGMKNLTGFDFKKINIPEESHININWSGADKQSYSIKLPAKLKDYFAVNNSKNIKAIGRFSASKEIAFAYTQKAGYKSFYCAIPNVTRQLLTDIFSISGAWRYTDSGNIVITNGHFFSVTSPNGGNIKVKLPFNSTVYDTSNKLIASGHTFNLQFKRNETKCFFAK